MEIQLWPLYEAYDLSLNFLRTSLTSCCPAVGRSSGCRLFTCAHSLDSKRKMSLQIGHMNRGACDRWSSSNFPTRKCVVLIINFHRSKSIFITVRQSGVRFSRSKCSVRLTYMDLKIYELRVTDVSAYSNEFDD